MALETELKLRLQERQLHSLPSRLEKLGARLEQERGTEHNRLFDFPDRSLLKRGCALRLRHYQGSWELTFKGPLQPDPRLKKRQEWQIRLDDGEALLQILSALGLEVAFEYSKVRALYRLEREGESLEVCLDETPFGCFLEIEGNPKAVHRLVAELGLEEAPVEQKDYVRLYREHRGDGPPGGGTPGGGLTRSTVRGKSVRGMILAAGKGTRLYPLTLWRAKPAIPFLDRPFIRHVLHLMDQAQIREVVINLHHLPKTVRDAVGERTGIIYSYEEEILGTAGALFPVRDLLLDHTVVVCNGKIYYEGSLEEVLEFHRSREAVATLVMVPHQAWEGFSPVMVDEHQRVRAFAGSPIREGESPFPSGWQPYTFTGIHILSPAALLRLLPGPSDLVRDFYPRLLEAGERVLAYLSQAYWCECSRPERYLRKSVEVLSRRGLPWIGEAPDQSLLDSVVVGRGCRIGEGSQLRNCLLWEGVQIGRGCLLTDVIIADGAELPDGYQAREMIITRRLEGAAGEGARQDSENDLLLWPLPGLRQA